MQKGFLIKRKVSAKAQRIKKVSLSKDTFFIYHFKFLIFS
jgi:ACT domain-containing protein